MMHTLRSVIAVAWLLLRAGIMHAAINIDGTQAVNPVGEDDFSPIGDPTTYCPDQHNCPLPCVDYANMHSWIPYFSTNRLARCKAPMLLQFSVSKPLDDPASDILIRSCTLAEQSPATVSRLGNSSSASIEISKKASRLFQASLDVAPACAFAGTQVKGKVELVASSNGGKGNRVEVDGVLKGLQKFFDAQDNCDENFAFAYYGKTVASIYIGPGLGKLTVESAIKVLGGRLENEGSVANRTVAQLCSSERCSVRAFSVAINTTGDLAAVQQIAAEWFLFS
jgi:hypothetical protein